MKKDFSNNGLFSMPQHNCCVNTKAIIDYISARHDNIEDLLLGLDSELKGIPSPLSFLSNPHNWVSSDVCGKMYANARTITGDDEVAFNIGFESVTNKRLGYIQEILLKAIGTPRAGIKRAHSINSKFNRNKEVKIIKLRGEEAIIRLHWDASMNLVRDFCLMNKGIYSALSTVWDLPPARLTETCCHFDGAPYCEYKIEWEKLSIVKRLRTIFGQRRKLLTQSLIEIERDKRLLENKFLEVQSLNRSLQERLNQLVSIHEASHIILSELEFDILLPEVLRIFLREIEYSRGLIMLCDYERNVLRAVEVVGEHIDNLEDIAGYEISLSRKHNILIQVLMNGRPVIAPDVTKLNLNPQNIIIRSFKPKSVVILPLLSRGRVIGVLAADQGSNKETGPPPDVNYLQGFANQVALAIENARMYKELRVSYLTSIQALVEALEAKDPYTRGHSERVTKYTESLAGAVGLPDDQIQQLRNMCLVHDIGKIGIDRMILNKNGKLLDTEFGLIRNHPIIGHKIIEPLNLPKEETAIVRHHHERYDGNGYPDGLSGEDIPMAVRIVSICDTFDAMTSDRPYRKALSLNEAIMELRCAAGTQLDPKLVRIFESMVRQGRLDDILNNPFKVA